MSELTPKEKITKARAGLILDAPFFGALALKLKPIESDRYPTGWTDGITLGFNPDWLNNLEMDQVKGFICHEIMHCALSHMTRRQQRNARKWNKAADYAINLIIKDAGFKLPDEGLMNNAYRDMMAEEIYPMLEDEPEVEGQSDPGGCGAIEDAPSPNGSGKANHADLKKIDQDWKIDVTKAAQAAKMQGNLPGGISKLVEEMNAPQLDWRKILREFVEKSARNDYSWATPNRRYIAQNLYLPSLHSKEIGTVVISIDTSGSVSEGELKQFASEISSILEEFGDLTAQVIYCDTKVAHTEEFHSTDLPIKLEMHGGGGTDFRPPFKWVEDKLQSPPTCHLYFTDLCCSRYPEPPEYPVMWINTSTYGDTPPFGEVISLDQNPR